MKKSLSLAVVVLSLGSVMASASSLISRSEAEQEAQHVVGGGTVTQAVEEKELGKIIWSVDITGVSHEFEVWLDAHSGATLRIIKQPLSPSSRSITMQQAEQDALKAAGGGTVAQIQHDQWKGYQIWDVTVLRPGFEFDIFLDARTGAVLQITKIADNAAAKPSMISKAQAEKVALEAVGGGTVLLVVLEKTDNPPDWSVDVLANNGNEYEVKVNLYTGKVFAIIIGG